MLPCVFLLIILKTQIAWNNQQAGKRIPTPKQRQTSALQAMRLFCA
jgi:hypothetical protein